MIGSSPVVMANKQLESMKKEQAEIKEQMENKQTEISDISSDINNVNEEIKVLDSQIRQSEMELSKIQEEINILNEKINETLAQLNDARDNLFEKEDELSSRVREQYMNGDVVFLDIIFGSSSISEMLTKVDIVQSVINQDKELMEFTDRQIDFIEKIEDKLRIQENELREIRKQELEKKSQLETNNAKKESLLKSLVSNKEFAEVEYSKYEGQNTNLAQKIQQLEKELEEKRIAEEKRRAEEARRAAQRENRAHVETKVPSGTGKLAWPVQGHNRISSPYGYRTHPIFGTRLYHAGLDIPAPTGTPITAAADGIVIFAGWQGGYGNCVMISHGNGLVTLYAHNSSLSVLVGDYVTKGETLALCGSTGYSTGPHLHFEVRVDGSTVDPMGWL